MEKANIHTPPNPCLPALYPWLDIGVVACSCLRVHLSLSGYMLLRTCAVVTHLQGSACERIRQLQSWAPGLEGNFICRSASRRSISILFQRGSIHSFTPGKKRMTQRLMMMMIVVTGAAASQGRLMIYPSTPPLCVNATLNYLVVFQVWGMHPALVL